MVLLLTFVLLTSFESLIYHFIELGMESVETLFFFGSFVFFIVSLGYFLYLFIFHVGLIYNGLGTVEKKIEIQFEIEHGKSQKNKSETFEEYLGKNVLTWLLPTGKFFKILFYKFVLI